MGPVETWEIVLGLAFLLGSAFTSASETALTALGEARARQLLDGAGARARMLRIWVEHPERVLSTLLVANNVVSIGAGALAGSVGAKIGRALGMSEAVSVAAATAVATVIILFFGEILPKTLAKRHAMQGALLVIPFVRFLYFFLAPVASGLVKATDGLVRLFGGSRPTAPAVTGAEIEYLIEMGTREGVLDEVKEELLNSVLEFADRVVKEVMIPRTRMVAVDKDLPPEEIVRIVTQNPYSRMPVYQGTVDNVVGILLVRDIVPELAKGSVQGLSLDRWLKPAFFVPEQMKISRLLKEMQKRRTHLAVVVDEFGGTSGICSLEDVIEEIVGEIQDEGDAEAAPVKAVGEGQWLAEASIPLHDLEEYLNHQVEGLAEDREHARRFPEDGDYETLGGFLTASAGRVPQVGAQVVWEGLTFTVRAGDERRVTRVEIARSAAAPQPQPAREPAAQEGA
ncbi:MAG: HlyC/CorC family transporter [Deltaproteobacteria bacterium]|nr:HlyC/CorC family transporter [Deltaproteobacteria bacterium]